MKKVKYRIVVDEYAGYEVHIKRWWFPFWIQCGMNGEIINTHLSIEDAKQYITRHKSRRKLSKAVYSE